MAPGLFGIRLALPGHSIGHVNIYLLRGPSGYLMVDTGWSAPGMLKSLTQAMSEIGVSPDNVSVILLTHLHTDHCGLAGELARDRHVTVGMHPADSSQLVDRYLAPKPYVEATRIWLGEIGAPPEVYEFAYGQVAAQGPRFSPLDVTLDLADSDTIEHGDFRISVLRTPGHTPGSVCFFERTTLTLFSGDTLFARRNYSPTLRPLGLSDPLGAYRRSVDRLAKLDADIVLPGHGRSVIDLPARVTEVRRHHQARSDAIDDLARTPGGSIWELTSQVPRPRDWHELPAAARLSAIGEVYAHLVDLGRVPLSKSAID